MRQLATIALVFPLFSLAGSVSGQSYFASPAIADKNEGLLGAGLFGRYAEMRCQLFEGDFRGKAAALTAVDFRLDTRRQVDPARLWANVRLRMSACDVASVTQTFTSNFVGTPTRVYSATVSWPAISGLPTVHRPTAWGAPGGGLAFPFTSPWQHTGVRDFLLEFRFRGGVMANKAPWSGSTGYSRYLDADQVPITGPFAPPLYGTQLRIPTTPNGCSDQGLMLKPVDGAEFFLDTFVQVAGTFKNKITMGIASSGTAPGKNVIHAVGLAGIPNGIAVGARCQKLHLDTSKPFIATATVTDARRGWGQSGPWTAGFTPALGQVELWGQGAWNDSVTGAFSLTRAVRMLMPMHMPVPQNRLATFATGWSAKTGNFVPSRNADYLPVARYTKK